MRKIGKKIVPFLYPFEFFQYPFRYLSPDLIFLGKFVIILILDW